VAALRRSSREIVDAVRPSRRATSCMVLKRRGILISMSGKGNCYDNAVVETFFKTLKSELVRRAIFHARLEAEQAIARYIGGFYNPVRRHSSLELTSSAQFEKLAAE
jgi:putative transposase